MFLDNRPFLAYFDGACEPQNPDGTASYGAVVLQDHKPIWTDSQIYDPPEGQRTSNNAAEYAGLIALLEWFSDQELFDAKILIRGDSQLVINQIFGTWRIKEAKIYTPLGHSARELIKPFRRIQCEWVAREKDTLADELAKAALKRVGVALRLPPD